MAVHWNPPMDNALRTGLARGHSLALIAEDIGVARGTAATRADALGLERPRRQSPREKAERLPRNHMELAFADCLADGLSPQEAADRVGAANGNSMLQRIRYKLGPQAV